MKNIINAKPDTELHGRVLYSTQFVDDTDVKNKDILDIGCGFGWFELDALKKGCHKIVGLELSNEDLKTAKENIKDERIEFGVGSAINIPYENKVFDTIVTWEVVEHIPCGSETQMFGEANRVLRDDGMFYLSTPLNNFFADAFDPAWWLIGHRHYSKNKIVKLGENNGFKIEKIILSGGIWEILGINNLYIAKWIFRRQPFFEKFFHKKQDAEYKKEKGFTNIFIKFRKINDLDNNTNTQ